MIRSKGTRISKQWTGEGETPTERWKSGLGMYPVVYYAFSQNTLDEHMLAAAAT